MTGSRMQDEDQELSSLDPEAIQRAIEAVRARAWDINPFTVADELKVSRAAVYRHSEVMKLIVAARGGSFGMDVHTSLDLTRQLRQLEQQNNELKEKLATSGSHQNAESLKQIDESNNLVPDKNRQTGAKEDIIFNFAANGPTMNTYLNQLAHLSWKDVETVYYFRVASLSEYAKKLFSLDPSLKPTNGGDLEVHSSFKSGAISYGSLVSLEANRRNKQALSSPFAQLKSGSLGTAQKDSWFEQEPKGQARSKLTNKSIIGTSAGNDLTANPVMETEQINIDVSVEKSKLVIELDKDLPSPVELKESVEVGPPLIEKSVKPDVPRSKPSDTDQKIKLIPLFKDKSLIDQTNLYSPKDQTETGEMEIVKRKSEVQDSSNSRDELRDLIQSHIRNAAEQMAESSIGAGKEYEVWLNNPARSKFVGSTKSQESASEEELDSKDQAKNTSFKPRVVPPDVRKSCLILGVRPDKISYEAVQDSWKKAIAAPGVHPDLGGDTELAIYLNTAKDVLMHFLDAQAPKLGKKFGPFKVEKESKPRTDKSADKSKGEQ